MEREYTDEKRRALFSRGGLYYELREDYSHALDCYAKGGDHSKGSERWYQALVRFADRCSGQDAARVAGYFAAASRSTPATSAPPTPGIGRRRRATPCTSTS